MRTSGRQIWSRSPRCTQVVGETRHCVSACFLIFAAGAHRVVFTVSPSRRAFGIHMNNETAELEETHGAAQRPCSSPAFTPKSAFRPRSLPIWWQHLREVTWLAPPTWPIGLRYWSQRPVVPNRLSALRSAQVRKVSRAEARLSNLWSETPRPSDHRSETPIRHKRRRSILQVGTRCHRHDASVTSPCMAMVSPSDSFAAI